MSHADFVAPRATAAARVLEIAPYPPPHSGWSVRVFHLKRALEQNGHECVVLNIGANRRIPSPDYETVASGLDYARKVWRFVRKGFIAHVHVNGSSPKGFVLALMALALSWLTRRPSVLTFHAGVQQQYFPRPKSGVLTPLLRALFRLPQRIVCNDSAVAALIADYGVAPGKVVPIPAFTPHYLDTPRAALPPALEAFYSRMPAVVLCYLRLLPAFEPVTVLDAFAVAAGNASTPLGIVFCGVGDHADGGLSRAMQSRLSTPALRDRVILIDDLSHGQFLHALERSTFYLRSHVSDGVCSSILEALALSVPVLAVENGHRPAGVVTYPRARVEELAAALRQMVERRDSHRPLPGHDLTRDSLTQEVQLLLEIAAPTLPSRRHDHM